MKEYFNKLAGKNLKIGGVLVILALVGVLTRGGASSLIILASGALWLLVGVLMRRTPIVRLFDDRIEVKGGPLASNRIVALGEIERVDSRDVRVIVLHTARGPVRIPAFFLEDYQRREILRALGEPA